QAQHLIIATDDGAQGLFNRGGARAGAGRNCRVRLRWSHRLRFYCIAVGTIRLAAVFFNTLLCVARGFCSSDERAGTDAQSNLSLCLGRSLEPEEIAGRIARNAKIAKHRPKLKTKAHWGITLITRIKRTKTIYRGFSRIVADPNTGEEILRSIPAF